MFCSNCGFRMNEGSKFCPSCGSKIASSIISERPKTGFAEDLQEEVQEEVTYQYDKSKDYHTNEIVAAFNAIFKNCTFTEVVFPLVRKPYTTRYLQDQIKKALLGYPGEDILMYINAGECLEFLLTNYGMVYYIDRQPITVELSELKSLESVSKAMGTEIRFVFDDDMVSYPFELDANISQVGIFVAKLKKFIESVYDIFHHEIEMAREEARKKAEQEKKKKEVERLKGTINQELAKAIMAIANNQAYKMPLSIVRGAPLDKSCDKFDKARKWFKIPDFEDIYLIYDPTTFGACNKGFAICSTGIYLKEEKNSDPQKMLWNEFKYKKVKYSSILGLTIVDTTYSREIYFPGEKVLKNILLEIQNIIP